MKRGFREMVVAAALLLVSGCTSVTPGYAKNRAGRAAAAKMCESMRAFVRAPFDASGLRRAWFLPFGSYGAIDFYAPMAANPSDDASKAFYEHKVGQLTHYLLPPEFAAALSSCLTQRDGFVRSCQSQTEKTFRASFREARSGRSIEIAATEGTTSLLIAEKEWNGDREEALVFRPGNEKLPDEAVPPTCEEARS